MSISSRRLGAVSLVALTAVGLTSVRPSTVSAQSASNNIDYAVEAFGDAWDWSGPEDGYPAEDLLSQGIPSSRVEGGQVSFTVNRPSFWFFLQGGYADSTPTGRDASAHPVDASRFNRIVFKMTASQNMSAGLLWFGCASNDNCVGGVPLDVRAGTHVYDIALGAPRLLTRPWSGQITSMRFDFDPRGSTDVAIDWVRLTSQAAGAVDQWNGPMPTILDPDETGGDDFATLTRNGDAWDFSQPSDVLRADNAQFSVRDGEVHGVNAAPAMNDPSVTMKVPVAFKGDDFHRMTVKWTFDGPFSLKDSPGGGMNARIVWRIMGTPPTSTGEDLQESRDIVMYPWDREFTVDLKTNPAADVTDPRPTKKRIGWAGQMIELVRFDPNEDPGPRAWRVDEVRLAADDAGENGFDIKLADRNAGPGTSVDVFVDRDRNGFDGDVIARDVDLSSGQATVQWRPPAGTAGTYWVYVTARRGSNAVSRYSSGPVQIGRKSGAGAYEFGPAVGGPASQVGISDAPAGAPAAAPINTPATTAPPTLALKPVKKPGRAQVKAQVKGKATTTKTVKKR